MKTLLMSVIALSIIGSNAMATDRNYECIANRLKEYNSAKYAHVTTADIDSMITIVEMSGHIDAVKAEKACLAESQKYQCVINGLEAYNSDVYYNLSTADIDTMLSIPEMAGHMDAFRIAKRCGLR